MITIAGPITSINGVLPTTAGQTHQIAVSNKINAEIDDNVSNFLCLEINSCSKEGTPVIVDAML